MKKEFKLVTIMSVFTGINLVDFERTTDLVYHVMNYLPEPSIKKATSQFMHKTFLQKVKKMDILKTKQAECINVLLRQFPIFKKQEIKQDTLTIKRLITKKNQDAKLTIKQWIDDLPYPKSFMVEQKHCLTRLTKHQMHNAVIKLKADTIRQYNFSKDCVPSETINDYYHCSNLTSTKLIHAYENVLKQVSKQIPIDVAIKTECQRLFADPVKGKGNHFLSLYKDTIYTLSNLTTSKEDLMSIQWGCETSPDGVCHYHAYQFIEGEGILLDDNNVKLIDDLKKNALIPLNWQEKNASWDWCMFCGEPFERK